MVDNLVKSDKIKEKVEKDSKRTFFEKITRYIPIYHGYKVKELRREADKILRDHISRDLKRENLKLKDIRDKIVEEDMQELWRPIENAISDLDTITQKIQYADYGFAAFFDAVKINEEELDRLYEFDSSLIEDIKVVQEVIEELENQIDESNTSDLKKHIKRIDNICKQLEDKLEKRDAYMNKFTD